MKHKFVYGIIGAIVLAFVALVFFTGSASSSSTLKGVDVTFYKSQSCGCCSIYESYLQNKGTKMTEIIQADLTQTKERLGIPAQLQSCHSYEIGGYFVEGHIPAEAVEKLLLEKPNIAGIAMPGMPSGSPGMPGAKTGPFVIYSVNKDGTYQEFMRI